MCALYYDGRTTVLCLSASVSACIEVLVYEAVAEAYLRRLAGHRFESWPADVREALAPLGRRPTPAERALPVPTAVAVQHHGLRAMRLTEAPLVSTSWCNLRPLRLTIVFYDFGNTPWCSNSALLPDLIQHKLPCCIRQEIRQTLTASSFPALVVPSLVAQLASAFGCYSCLR